MKTRQVGSGRALCFMEKIIREYLNWKGTYARKASINYRIWLDYFVKVCGIKNLEEYTTEDVVKYHEWLEIRYSPFSIQLAFVALKNFLQYCQWQNYPCLSPVLIKLPRAQPKSHRAVSESEYNLIISVIPQKLFINLRDLILIRLLWDTGVRVSELCDINVSQIDENKRSTVIQTKKNGRKRIIVWSDETHKLLIKYITLRVKLTKCSTSSLFVGLQKGRDWTLRLTFRTVERVVKYYVDRAGIKERITPHSFRHGWAHKRRDQNAPLSFIQKGLGHINPISTFVYEQYNDNEFEKNANTYLKIA